jgi:hypothetical protein
LFYAIATCVGALAPTIFGAIVASGERGSLAAGYVATGGVMLLGAVAELILGEAAEGKSLEQINQVF